MKDERKRNRKLGKYQEKYEKHTKGVTTTIGPALVSQSGVTPGSQSSKVGQDKPRRSSQDSKGQQ